MAMLGEVSVIYTNGRKQDVKPTVAALAKAEAHLAKMGLNMENGGINGSLYAVYATLRAAGETAMPYEQWLNTIETFGDDDKETDEGKALPAA